MAKKKTSKKRGSREHGRGKKAGRGAGLRGGRGNAGVMKHKRVGTQKRDPNYWGDYGFKRPDAVVTVKETLNVHEVDELLPDWIAAGDAEDGDPARVDLGALGYDKLLGSGQVRTAVAVTVAEATASAVRKVEAAGGSVTLTAEDDDASDAPEGDEDAE